MKRRYLLVLSLVFVILTMSYVSAADNVTDVVKQESDDVISVCEQDADNVSISQTEAVGDNLNQTGDVGLLGSVDGDEILTIPSSGDVLATGVTVKPLTSSYYKEPTKQQRTFNIAGFKAVLSQSQYKKLYLISSVEDSFFDDGYYEYYYVGEKFRGYDISSSGLRQYFKVKTNKYVKVKVKSGKKVFYKKARVYMFFAYGQGQCGVAYRHMMFLTHNYANPGYDSAEVMGYQAKYFGKCKHSASFTKLNKSKLTSINYVYKKYDIY